ncbi:hypothetical protein M011DRAFT_234463 [Sporormia fimetaria CBS 119925]|uniref:Uncharacterized protein n=1 Tax=Sporormia fimetaria CBS 119925 TaxID=1340428 RepID=A0A6A6VKI4_9PLEO|nr:hypothetical protein M011DRAFT_234463 [Sporormia fimetaria CBS 119925]
MQSPCCMDSRAMSIARRTWRPGSCPQPMCKQSDSKAVPSSLLLQGLAAATLGGRCCPLHLTSPTSLWARQSLADPPAHSGRYPLWFTQQPRTPTPIRRGRPEIDWQTYHDQRLRRYDNMTLPQVVSAPGAHDYPACFPYACLRLSISN